MPNFAVFISSSTYAILAHDFELSVVDTLLPTLLDVLSNANNSESTPSASTSHSRLNTSKGIKSSTYSK